jgi:hypothetical protein
MDLNNVDGQMKTCSTCGLEKLLSEYSPRKGRPLGVHYSCKVCLALRAKEARKTKKLSPDQRESARLRAELWRKQNPLRNRQMKSSWRSRNLHIKNANSARRRSSKLKATPAWLSEEMQMEIQSFYWLTQDLKSITGEEYHVDHVIPLINPNICGLHVPWNLQVLPADLNLQKGNTYAD